MPKIIAAFGRLKLTSPAERPIHLLVILIALFHAFLAVTAVNTKSPTFDEPQHLTAGVSYWMKNDFRLDPENGNFPARWAALPLIFGSSKFVPVNGRAWEHADEGGTAHQFFYEAGNDPDRMIAQARLMMSIFGVALCLLIYRIAREFFGVPGGLIAETLIAFDPNFLAHSALVTADVAAAFFFTATIWSFWRLLQKISPATLAFAALSLSGLLLSKFSAPIVLPVLGVMSVLQVFSRNELEVKLARFRVSLHSTWKRFGAISATWVVVGLTALLTVWLSFSFRYSALTDDGPARKVWDNCWNTILSDRTLFQEAIGYARNHHLLPEAYLCGLAYTRKSAELRPSFLDSQWSLVGFPSFFPLAFLYKTALPFLCLIGLAAFATIGYRKRWRNLNLLNPFLLFVLIYWAFAIGAQLNIGHRHILPIYPVLFVGSGAVVYLLQTNRRMIFAGVVAILLAWQIGESFAVRPNYLAYFNQIAGGPQHGYQHLVDSSLDWGQDLPALKTWIDDHGSIVQGKPVYLAYFGASDPKSYGIYAKSLPEDHAAGDQTFAPLQAGIYCVSATTLQSVYALEIGAWSQTYEQAYQRALAQIRSYRATASDPSARVALIANGGAVSWVKKIRTFERLRFERLCAYLRQRPPQAQVGYSIFVFDVTGDEIDRALYGEPAELTREVYVTGY